jgi:ERCC4-type nuclease
MKKSLDNIVKQFRVIVDTREQLPYKFENSITGTLLYGDYTVEYEGDIYLSEICVERKSRVAELYQATGKDRIRWEKELERLSKISLKFILCEFSYMDIIKKLPPGKLEPQCVYGSIAKWQVVYNVPFIFCENRTNARALLWKMFYEFVKHKIIEKELVL